MQKTDNTEQTDEKPSRLRSAPRETQQINLAERLALTPREFGAALGKSATYGYRAIYRRWVNPVSDRGRLMIPISEVHRFLGRAAEYNPQSKAKVEKHKAVEGEN